MRELTQAITREQPRINAEIERHLAFLPPLARPVATHVLGAGGKRLRPLLTLLMGRAFSKNTARIHDEALYTLGAAVEMLHAATLLHDDILDNATLRRGKAAAHTVYGATPVILAGDALLAKALLMVSSFGDARFTNCISEAVMRTAEGEMAEFSHLGNGALRHNEYIDIITGKTAWMLRASCELGALFAEGDDAAVRAAVAFGLELGIAFQMVDDALDFAPSEKTGKPTGGDLREGKATPPLLSYFTALPEEEARVLREKFASGSFCEQEIAAVSEAVRQGGHDSATRTMAAVHLERARTALGTLPDCPEREILREMTEYIQHREI